VYNWQIELKGVNKRKRPRSVRSKERKGNEQENSGNFVLCEQTWERERERERKGKWERSQGVTMLDSEVRAISWDREGVASKSQNWAFYFNFIWAGFCLSGRRQILPPPLYPLPAPPYNFFIPWLSFMKLHKYSYYFLKLWTGWGCIRFSF